MNHHIRVGAAGTWQVILTPGQNLAVPGQVLATFAHDDEAGAGRLIRHLHNLTGDHTPDIHPEARRTIAALTALAAYRPTGPADLGRLLQSINDDKGPSVLSCFTAALDALADTDIPGADPDQVESFRRNLYAATELLSTLGGERIDRARADAQDGAR